MAKLAMWNKEYELDISSLSASRRKEANLRDRDGSARSVWIVRILTDSDEVLTSVRVYASQTEADEYAEELHYGLLVQNPCKGLKHSIEAWHPKRYGTTE